MADFAVKEAISAEVAIVIAGDYAKALDTCRRHTMRVGLCVTVTPTTYVYTGGQEEGVRVGFMNYPRFPKEESELMEQARQLALELAWDLNQNSFSIIGPTRTEWHSRRAEDLAGAK